MGALVTQTTMASRIDTDEPTPAMVEAAPENLVVLAVAAMEWSPTPGMLDLLHRDAPGDAFQRPLLRDGALMAIDGGIGAASVVAVSSAFEPEALVVPRVAAPAPPFAPAAEPAPAAEAAPAATATPEPREPKPKPQPKPKPEPKPKPKPKPKPEPNSWQNAPHVTWYGPGFYGNRTACGQRYTRKIIGVAHRTLPCGTMVQFRWNGITATAPVIDRGPYGPAGYVFDFSAALACDVFKPRGVSNACFTRHDVLWRVVRRPS